MKIINKHIEIVSSSNKRLSSMSEKSYIMIKQSLSKYYKNVGITLVDDLEDLEKLVLMMPDLVFLGVKRIPRTPTKSDSNPYIWVSEYLEKSGIPYTGSGVDATILEQDKNRAKDIIKKAGLKTSPYFVTYTKQHTSESQIPLKFPLFIKPPNLSGGMGVNDASVVHNFKQYKSKIKSLENDFGSESLVEEYLTGREFTVAILQSSTDLSLQTSSLEILPTANKQGDYIIGSDMKSSSIETPVNGVEKGEMNDAITNLASNAFKAIGASGYGRVDIRLNSKGEPHFMEINLIPSTINGSGNFQKAIEKNLGLKYDDMLLHIVNLGFTNNLQRTQS
jgi:D-alanine-D-alanine ligase